MSISLYSATVPSFQQMLGTIAGLLDKAEAHCADTDMVASDLIGARLAPDMLPFGYQVRSVVVHSVGAIEGVRRGVFGPDRSPWPESFDALRQMIDGARTILREIDRQEIDGFTGRDMRFEFGDYRMDFTAEDFLLSFSLPNFYFHTTTAYDILRAQGVPLGKRDFLGSLRTKE